MKEKTTREILVSGYGPGKAEEPSISLYTMTDDLKLEHELWTDKALCPSFLCIYENMCFGIREDSKSGAVLCYQRLENQYILRDELLLEGGALCHIVYQPVNQTLYCSFYETGHVATVKVENYHFSEVLSFIQIQPEQSAGYSRVHCCELSSNQRTVLTTNIALDRIYLYDVEKGRLKPNPSTQYIQLEKGVGPRHLKFHPLKNYLYLITEYSNEIFTFLYENETSQPSLLLLQRITTLPEYYKGTSTGSSLTISKDGRFLYAANRGANTIAVYRINQDGTLEKIQDSYCGGDFPRHIALTKDDMGLMVANQNSDEVVILSVNKENGTLSEVLSKQHFYQPSYIEEI